MSNKKFKNKKKKKLEKQRKKTKKIVSSLLDDMVTRIEEYMNPEDYFNIVYLTRKEIEFIIDIDKSNVDMLNNLHVEKINNEGIYSKLYVRKNKEMDLEKWILIEIEDKSYLVSSHIIKTIRTQIEDDLSDEDIAKIYIEKDSDITQTILFILEPEFTIEKKEVVLTEEQRKAKEMRDFLNEKNRIFNNRMKHQNSITKNKSSLDFKEI
tara:strand:- start:557 stop:1183 length:627 start_codon:yes stop_codon:yes gene_type:complete